MADEEKIYKCPSCGGFLQWSPEDQKLKCPYCGSVYDVSQFEQEEQQVQEDVGQGRYQKGETTEETGADRRATDDTEIDPEDLRVYRCQNCGAEIVTDKTTAATACAFCGSPVVLIQQFDTEFRPEWIVPFRVDKKEVQNIYRKYIRTRPFYPGAFLREAVVEKMRGVYIPFWLYGMHMRGDMTATGENIFTTRDANYIYTTHRVFRLIRGGQLEVQNLPVDSSSRTPDGAMDSIEPFDFSRMVPFRMSYLPGYYAERYDQDAQQCADRAMHRAEESVREQLMSTTAGFTNVRVQTEDIHPVNQHFSASYAMLPTYLLNVKYKNKDYFFAINGQTGHIIGDVPASAGKAALFTSVVFGITFAIALLISMLLFG